MLVSLESSAAESRAAAQKVELEARKRAQRLKWLGGRPASAAAADAQQVECLAERVGFSAGCVLGGGVEASPL